MITEFIITHDMELVERLLKRPMCYSRMVNDECPAVEDFHIDDDGRFISILAYHEAEMVGVFMLFPKSPAMAEVHFCLSPMVWGRTRRIATEFLQWVWLNTSIMTLTGPVPAYNRLALELALDVGFEKVAVKPNAIKKHGKQFDMIITEAVRHAA